MASNYEPPRAPLKTPGLALESARERSRITTLFAVVSLLFGIPGFLLSLFGLSAGLGGDAAATALLTVQQIVVDAVLSLISKLGLIATGIALLSRASSAPRVALGALVASLVHSAYAFTTTLPAMAGAVAAGPARTGAYFGGLAVMALSAGFYVLLLVHLRSETARGAFPSSSRAAA